MKVINFFGCPGAGKSTQAACLFWEMKTLGYNVELVTEYFKELVWENTAEKTTDYLYVLANQNRRLERLRDKLDFVITDSPLLLGGYYVYFNGGRHPNVINKLSHTLFKTYDNINFLIKIDERYKQIGRIHSYEQALRIETDLYRILENNNYNYNVVNIIPDFNIMRTIKENYL